MLLILWPVQWATLHNNSRHRQAFQRVLSVEVLNQRMKRKMAWGRVSLTRIRPNGTNSANTRWHPPFPCLNRLDWDWVGNPWWIMPICPLFAGLAPAGPAPAVGTCPGGASLPIECDPKRPWPQCPPQSYCYATNTVDIGPYFCCPICESFARIRLNDSPKGQLMVPLGDRPRPSTVTPRRLRRIGRSQCEWQRHHRLPPRWHQFEKAERLE